MRYLIIVLSCILTSCASNTKAVTYKTASLKAKVSLTKGFDKEIIEQGQDLLYKFTYPDSSILYITDEKGTPSINYENIENDSIAIQKSFLAHMRGKTLNLNGVDENGRLWRNTKLEGLSIGYLNVPKNRKVEFDNIISSLVLNGSKLDINKALLHEATHNNRN